MIRKTADLYRAAYWLAMGGELTETEGNYPKTMFSISSGKIAQLREFFNIVDWRVFKKKRIFLKNASLTGAFRKNRGIGDFLSVHGYKK